MICSEAGFSQDAADFRTSCVAYPRRLDRTAAAFGGMVPKNDQALGAHDPHVLHETRRTRRPALVASAIALAVTVVLVGAAGRGGGTGLGFRESLWVSGPAHRPLPFNFDVRWGHGNCRGFEPLSTADAGKCNAGHSLLLSAMLSARACMQDPNFDIKVSAQTILDCYPSGAGCLAPSYEAALAMLASQPIPDEQCNPLDAFPGEGYVAAPGDCEADLCHGAPRYKVDPATVSHVVASFAPDAAKVDGAEDSGAWVLRSGGEPALPISVQPLMEAVARGPVLGTVNVYFSSDRAIRLSPSERPISPFANLRKPVFDGPGKVADADKPDATHAVMVLGWGESDGARYWLVQDAVGRCFGDEGTFRVRMGANVLNLEAYGFWAADLDLEQARVSVRDTRTPDVLACAGLFRFPDPCCPPRLSDALPSAGAARPRRGGVRRGVRAGRGGARGVRQRRGAFAERLRMRVQRQLDGRALRDVRGALRERGRDAGWPAPHPPCPISTG